MSIPADLLYTDTHEWVRIEGDEAVIGITQFAQEQLGDLTFVDLPAVGDTLATGQEMGSVESVKAASELYSPLAGTVSAVNDALSGAPELVNQSPYTDGWMVRVKLSATPEGLLSAADYEAVVAREAH
ncbi:MAG: glycine cleavage system protein GcvH [Desulfovibrio sp.]|jgi:glycine cleavage system H protein|uniref:Glycine cleavage system H protein n=2 Tax=Nitratidesulfovibrio TaxID=2802295 RepID=GCSH_NITV9|nr:MULTISPECIES: glycine cleavage system protein GcvH [Nitratidesulfovibrio]B8DP97.1 RecName: Full=Glycine cleavage system H protein [Nitratidesulfovibrio vulgaris str. 'Miyazaki F']MDR3043243.1 glycine cleavage system protein GcvH [Desulfovibrio sp.]RXF78079.1 glycine cleavage system protein GcvH [Desulfovibrio sp. DS-1]MBG3878989.1 glycine cleavage system protein GcvH [Nitratidesulfovibrio oxamicus]MBZ2171612.1 glycine cleavage system protein GcvH [Nitratidesulfovibrio sp. SRB-5]NHZ46372.1 